MMSRSRGGVEESEMKKASNYPSFFMRSQQFFPEDCMSQEKPF